MRIYTIEQKQSQTTLQANLKVVLSISCDTSSNSYSSKNTVSIDENKIKSIKIGGNFIAYLTVDGQVFAVYYNVKENAASSTMPATILEPGSEPVRRARSPSRKKSRKPGNRERVDSLLSDLLREWSAAEGGAGEETMSTWGGSLTTASQSDVTGGGHNAEERADIEAAEIPSVSSQRSVSIRPPINLNNLSDTFYGPAVIPVEPDVSLTPATDVYLSEYYNTVQSRAGTSELEETHDPHVPESQSTSSKSNKPEVSQPVQWANCRNTSLYFTMIAATKCAVLLVCSNGQLWRWDMLDNTFEEHPLYKLYCGDKAVVKIHSSNLRITVLLDTGEIAVFYDNFVSGLSQPMIISELSHSAEQLPVLEDETVVDIKSGDFISAVLTQSGKVFWWGMLQKEMSAAPSKNKSSPGVGSIKSGSQVVLKNKANDILIGSLVYTAYPQSKLGRVEGCSGNSVIVRLCDRTPCPSAEKPKVETWSNSQIVVLETTIVPLGTVIGVHGTNAIIMTSRHTDPALFRNEWKQYRRMFSEGQLDKLDEDVEMEPKKGSNPNQDETVMDIDGSSVASDASHANSAYPNLCVYPVSDLEFYESGGFSHKVQKGAVELLASKTANLHDFDALAFSIDHIGNVTVLGKNKVNNNIYMLTKDSVSEDCEAIQAADSSFLADMTKLSMLSTPDVVMVLDNNSVPFVPPLPTCLNFREFNYLPGVNAIDIKQEVSTVPGKSRLIVAIAKQSQVVMPIVLQGDLKYLTHIQQQDRGASSKLPLHKSKLPTWGEVVQGLQNERDACGRTCLHVCAIAKPNPKKTSKQPPSANNSLLPIRVDDSNFHSITLLKRDCSFEELRFRHYTVERQKELKEHDRWLNIMRFICSVESLDLPKLLAQTDSAGYTPFIAAIASKNYNNAWYLLPIIAKLDKDHPGLMKRAVWKTLLYNTNVNHILAQGLLHNALIIQQIPSWCTEQTLHNLFSQNYHSIYKVLIQQKPKNMVKSVGRRLFDTTKPMTVRDRILRSFMRGPTGSTSTSHLKYSSKQQQGILFFSDPLEARKALIQMDGYVIPAKTNAHHRTRTSNLMSYSNPGGFFEVSVRFVAREVRGFFLTPSKKKKTRVKEEFEIAQENYRRMLADSLLKDYDGSVNDLAETPLATFINESIFSKLEDRKKGDKGIPSDHLHSSHRTTHRPTDRLLTAQRTPHRGLHDNSANFTARTIENSEHAIPRRVSRPIMPISSIHNASYLQRHSDIEVDRYNASNSEVGSSYLRRIPRVFSPAHYSTYVMGPNRPFYSIFNRTRSSESEVGGERANFSISGSDIEEEETNVTLPSTARYFDELQEAHEILSREEHEMELRHRTRPSADISIFGGQSSGQGSGWGDIRQYPTDTMSDDMFLPFESLLPGEAPSSSVSRAFEEGLAYALTGLPSTSNPASSPIATSSTNALAGSSSSSGITPPLIIKSESKAPQPVTDKPNKATDTSRSDDIPDSVYERQETSLECVAKQLCQNEVVVVTTIYCSYTGTKTLPEDLMRSDKSDVSKESSSAEDRASKRRRLDSSSEQPSGPGYSQSEIEKVLERVDGTPYCSEMTAFIHNLVANTDNGPDIVETLCKMLGKRAPSALFISLLFVRSLTKYLAVQLTNIGPRECLEDLPEYRLTVETQKLLTSFGWLAVREILHSAEALFLPIQYNTFKSQTHSTAMEHHIFPHPPGFMFASSTSPAISLHPSTYMRQCPLLSDRPTSPRLKRKLALVADSPPSGHDEEEISGDELTDEDSVQDESSHSFLNQINFFDVMDNFFNPNSSIPQPTNSEEDPYLNWAVDGQTTTFRPVFRSQHSAEEMTLLRENSNERGKNILSCVYSRLVKSGTDIAKSTNNTLCEVVKSSCETLFQSWWSWLEPILTSLEAQFVKAKKFDLERYSAMLKQGERKIRALYNLGNMSKSSITASFSQEYVMYLLDSHTSTSSKALPILDIKSYKHVVYIFDAMFYSITNWPRNTSAPGSSGLKTGAGASEHATFLKRSPSLDFSQDALSPDEGLQKDLERSVEVQFPLALQSHLLNPMATREQLFSSVHISDPKEEKCSWSGKESLKQAMKSRSQLLDFTPPEFLSTFESTTRVFSMYYLGEGPGIEKDSVLNLNACYSGKTARFVRQIKEVKLLVQSQNRQEMRDLPPRIYNLHIYVNRSRLLSDSVKSLLEMTQLHPVNYSVKFDGEEGGGPGVNRGWFSVVCSALKDHTKYPDKTFPLFHYPGRLPEQANNMSPQSWDHSLAPPLYKQRLDGYKAIGRFLGLALWFKQTLPVKLCRHVWKYLLGRGLCWGDLAFYNSDLYEGLRAMLNDAKWMTEEEFVEVYPCTLEVEVNGKIRELVPGGSEIPLTKQNVEQYIQGYSEQLMVDSVVLELTALKQGFSDIIPRHVLAGLTAEDLTLLLSGGCGDIPFDKLCSIITFVNSIGCSQKRLEQFKRWFWRIVKDMTQKERQQLLYFATGSSSLPPLDHNSERTRDRISITIDIQHDSRNALPMSSTCGQRISIPLYRSYSMLKSKLSMALQCLTYGLG